MLLPGGDLTLLCNTRRTKESIFALQSPVRVIHLIGPQLQDTSSSYSDLLCVRATGLVPDIPITGQRLSASYSSRTCSGSFMVSHVLSSF